MLQIEYVFLIQSIFLAEKSGLNLLYPQVLHIIYREIFGCSRSINRMYQNHVYEKNQYEKYT